MTEILYFGITSWAFPNIGSVKFLGSTTLIIYWLGFERFCTTNLEFGRFWLIYRLIILWLCCWIFRMEFIWTFKVNYWFTFRLDSFLNVWVSFKLLSKKPTWTLKVRLTLFGSFYFIFGKLRHITCLKFHKTWFVLTFAYFYRLLKWRFTKFNLLFTAIANIFESHKLLLRTSQRKYRLTGCDNIFITVWIFLKRCSKNSSIRCGLVRRFDINRYLAFFKLT